MIGAMVYKKSITRYTALLLKLYEKYQRVKNYFIKSTVISCCAKEKYGELKKL
jgi:hypothetical protein